MLILGQFATGNDDIITQIYSLLHISDPAVADTVLAWLAILSAATLFQTRAFTLLVSGK